MPPDAILSAATAGRGTLRQATQLMLWMGAPALQAVRLPLASVQPMSGLRKVPPERCARSCRMTSDWGVGSCPTLMLSLRMLDFEIEQPPAGHPHLMNSSAVLPSTVFFYHLPGGKLDSA